jgi:hypothetical protein
MRILVLVAATWLGCSSGGGGSVGGGSGDYCAAKTARAQRCEAGVVDSTECQQELACYNNIIRPELRDEIINCFGSRPCGTSDDSCVGTPASRLASDPTVKAFTDACLSKRSSCSNSFSDDHCGTFAVVTNAIRDKMSACLNGACDTVSKCFNDVYAAAGCD